MSRAPSSSKPVLPGLSRRGFLVGSAGLWVSVSLPRTGAAAAAARNADPLVFTPAEWSAVEAMTGRILPADESPGAIEARCVNFIDKVLAGEDAHALPAYQKALAALDELCRRRFDAPFVGLPETRQDALLTELEGGAVPDWGAPEAKPDEFFETLRLHTILGFVLDPRYGGNHGYAGWRAMGFPGPVHHMGGARPEHMTGEERFVPIWERESGGGDGGH